MAKTVLIVDDHAPFRALARALLQLEGFEVVGEAGEMVVEDAPAVTPSHPDHARQTPPPGRTVDMQCGSGWAVPAGLAGWSEPGNQAKGGDTW
jgi:ActR/RegA family two-component response regulator